MTPPDPDLTLHAWPIRPVGGQHAGPLGYGVLVVHEPTGLAVACTSERSQLANRELAIRRLRNMLAVYEAAGSAIDRLREHEATADTIRAAWRVDTTGEEYQSTDLAARQASARWTLAIGELEAAVAAARSSDRGA